MTWRFVSVAVSGLALFAACGIGYEVDLEGYCRLDPNHPDCAGFAGSTAGVAGLGGTAGAPLQGSAGMEMGAAGAGSGGGGSGGTGGVACAAPTTDCNGTCVDVKATDATNCGACGRRCLGTATCAQGACVPEGLASCERQRRELSLADATRRQGQSGRHG